MERYISPAILPLIHQSNKVIPQGLFLSLFYGRYPEKLKFSMWTGLVISFISLFVSSFVSSISGLIVLQGIGFGIGGGLLYTPVIVLLNEWFVRRRGLAGGIIFAGSGVGGKSVRPRSCLNTAD